MNEYTEGWKSWVRAGETNSLTLMNHDFSKETTPNLIISFLFYLIWAFVVAGLTLPLRNYLGFVVCELFMLPAVYRMTKELISRFRSKK